MSETEKVVNDRLSDKFFRRYTSRIFFVWLCSFAVFVCSLLWIPTDKMEYTITGDLMCYLSMILVGFNFIHKCVDSSKIESLAKIIQAAKE